MPETTVMKLHPTRFAFVKSYLGAVVLVGLWYAIYANVFAMTIPGSMLVLVAAVLLAASAEVRRVIETYTITDFRIMTRVGLLSTKESSVHWDRVADVQMDQSFFERLLRIGTITVQSSGGDEAPEILMKDIRKVHDVKTLIDNKMLEWKGRPATY